MTTLGISLGTTVTGVCVIEDGKLLDRQVHTFFSPWSYRKEDAIISRYRRYILSRGASSVIVKIPPLRRLTPALRKLLNRIEALAKRHGCEFDLVTKSELRHWTDTRSTRELVECSRMLYPELTALYKRGVVNGHDYHRKLYEAVLAAHFFHERQRRKMQTIE